MSDFDLGVCSEMVYPDLPIIDRIKRIREVGFAPRRPRGDRGRFTSMTGYLHGDLIDPATADEVVRTAELAIKPLRRLVFRG